MHGPRDVPDGPTPQVEIEALARFLHDRDEEFRRLEREVGDLRRQLRSIHTSTGWAVLRTLSQTRDALAPRGSRRERLLLAGEQALRRLKRQCRGLAVGLRARRDYRRSAPRPVDPSAHAVVCLPMIEWSFRFQRPQQLMRQFALRGHRVYYAANHFHRGTAARRRPVEPNVFETVLPGDPTANVYHQRPSPADTDRMADALSRMRETQGLGSAVVVAQLPFWTDLALRLRDLHGWTVVYDCMDDHAGFHDNTEAALEAEARLVAQADLVAASSDRLYQHVSQRARHAVLIRNACEYDLFASVETTPRPPGAAPVVGYYGAIAEWFDGDLVAGLARLRPGWRFELIGSTLAGDVSMLDRLPNVGLLGERPYADLPRLVAGWDAFVIPFKRVPLTEATNPVKVYEMLATGKPVVAVGLPELVPLADSGLIALGDDAPSFAAALDALLTPTAADPALIEARRAFARANTWAARHQELSQAIEAARPSAD